MVTRGAVLAAWLAAAVWLLWGDLLSSLLLPASHTYLATPHPPSPHTPPPAPSIPAHTLNTYREDGESQRRVALKINANHTARPL